MPNVKLASFPNSRIKPRAATRVANTFELDVPDIDGGGPIMLVAADPNRTYITIRNVSPSVAFKYFYRVATNPPPVAADFTFQVNAGETASNIESPQELWGLSVGPGIVPCEFDVGTG